MVGNGVDFSSEVEAFVTCQHYFACKVTRWALSHLAREGIKKIVVLNLISQGGSPSFFVKLGIKLQYFIIGPFLLIVS